MMNFTRLTRGKVGKIMYSIVLNVCQKCIIVQRHAPAFQFYKSAYKII